MANAKISALTGATTPLAGNEVLPIVQSGATTQVSVANLTTGRAISATQLTLTTGNLIVANGQGVDFSATPGTGTSELFNDYEEGTWTPTQGASLIVTGSFSSTGRYTKVGRLVTVSGTLAGSTSIASTAGSIMTGSLPFSSAAVSGGTASNATLNAGSVIFVSATNIFCTQAIASTTIIYFSATYSV